MSISKRGTVNWFNDSKGYGFIDCDGKSYFAHYTEIQTEGFKTLAEDMEVDFTPQRDERRGYVATKIQKVLRRSA